MKKKILIVSILCIFIFVILFLKDYTNVEWSNFITDINIFRLEKINNSEALDLSEYMVTYEEEETVLSDEEIDFLIMDSYRTYEGKTVISYEQAVIDIDYAFKLLKYSYGAYEYFGGDTVFNEVKKQCINTLNNEEIITNDILKKCLFDNLEEVIVDSHFTINGALININNTLMNFISTEYYFYLEDEKYYTFIDDKKYFIEKINGENSIESYMKQSIDNDGYLSYILGELINRNESRNYIEITLIDENGNELKEDVLLRASYRSNKGNVSAYEEYKVEGIQVLDVNSMIKQSGDNSLEYFIESGNKYKNDELLIIDLRGNTGGSDYYSGEWVKNYLGDYINTTTSNIYKTSKMNLINDIKLFNTLGELGELDTYAKQILDSYNKALENKEYGIWRENKRNGEFVKNDNLIFALIDKDVASSGEGFVDRLRHMENVIFVGENTRGCTLVPNSKDYILPNSEISLKFGNGVIIKLEGKNMDGKGFEPDIWTNSSDALDYTLKLIEQYNLK